MKCSVFIATSADGYIATKSGDVDWLEKAGNAEADMGAMADMGFKNFVSSVDCMIMGRKSMEKLASFNLTKEQWPYGDLPIFVLSNTLKEVPESMKDNVEIYAGAIPDLISRLEEKGYKHAYIDGGATITSFLNLGLINEMIITLAPVILGEGISLFGKTQMPIKLEKSEAQAYPNAFIQLKYTVSYN